MQDLSLHLLDIAENSVRAHATKVMITIEEYPSRNQLTMQIVDNGDGMSKQFARQVTDPFVTTRTTRKIGLGLPLLKQNCVLSGGNLEITSQVGKGTKVEATMQYHHIDRLPLGDIASSLALLIQGNPDICWIYTHCYEERKFTFNTEEIKQTLDGVPINHLEIIKWLRAYLTEGIEDLSSDDERLF